MTDTSAKDGGGILPVSPSQTIGPFFHDVVALTGSNEITPVGGGEPIRIEGRVLDGAGAPVDDALVEVWQPELATPEGGDGAGFARSGTTDVGRFSITTAKPDRPPDGAAPFVTVRLFARGLLRSLVTRIYFEDALSTEDPVLQSFEPDRRSTLIAERDDATDPPTYRLDIRLQGDHETVFFELRSDP